MSFRSFVRTSFLAATLALVGAPLAAQTISIDQGSVLAAGSNVKVSFSDPAMAGQDVTITVTGGFPVQTTVQLTITLNGNGVGSTQWTVSNTWRSVVFNGPGATELVCQIR